MYFGEFAEREKIRLKSHLRRHKSGLGVYVLVLSDKPDDILEIIPAIDFNNETYWKYHCDSLKVVGMAITKGEALSVAEKIVMDVYASDNGTNIKDYFNFRRY